MNKVIEQRTLQLVNWIRTLMLLRYRILILPLSCRHLDQHKLLHIPGYSSLRYLHACCTKGLNKLLLRLNRMIRHDFFNPILAYALHKYPP
ncbi:hypothetical protein D3C80_1843980 [compost metagenome]